MHHCPRCGCAVDRFGLCHACRELTEDVGRQLAYSPRLSHHTRDLLITRSPDVEDALQREPDDRSVLRGYSQTSAIMLALSSLVAVLYLILRGRILAPTLPILQGIVLIAQTSLVAIAALAAVARARFARAPLQRRLGRVPTYAFEPDRRSSMLLWSWLSCPPWQAVVGFQPFVGPPVVLQARRHLSARMRPGSAGLATYKAEHLLDFQVIDPRAQLTR